MPGARYEYVAGKWDDVATFKTCDRCVRVRDLIKDFEVASGCKEQDSFCPHRCIEQTLVDHDLTFASVFESGAKEKYLGEDRTPPTPRTPDPNGALM
jgi:hypothetical protein